MTYVTEVQADAPRAWYRLNEVSGNPQDSSGNGLHSTSVTGAPTYQQTGAIVGDTNKAIRFNAAVAHIDDNALLDLSDVWTVEAWVKLQATGITHGIVSKEAGAYYIRVSPTGKVELLLSQTAVLCDSGAFLITDTTTYHHLVGTKNGATIKLYIDGVDRTTNVANTVSSNNANALLIGSDDYDALSENANAVIDEVAVYATALSLARVQAHFNAANPSTAPSAPQSLSATDAQNLQVPLSWSAPASNGGSAITAYKIYRSLATGTETLYASPAGTGTTYTDVGVSNGTTYFYKVSAVNAIGESVLSNEATATPSAPAVSMRTFKRLYGPFQLGNAASLLYTCPASTTAIVRHIHVSNPSAFSVDFTLSIGANAPGTRIWDAQPIAAHDILDHYQEFTLEAGEIIQGFASLAATLNLTIDGYELGLVPSIPIYPSDTLFPSNTSP